MTRRVLTTRTAGLALIVGYGLFLVLLFVVAGGGLVPVTRSIQGTVLFILFPLLGLAGGAYVIAGRPLHATVAVACGSYLGITGIGLLFLGTGEIFVRLCGAVLFALGTLAILAPQASAVSELVPV